MQADQKYLVENFFLRAFGQSCDWHYILAQDLKRREHPGCSDARPRRSDAETGCAAKRCSPALPCRRRGSTGRARQRRPGTGLAETQASSELSRCRASRKHPFGWGVARFITAESAAIAEECRFAGNLEGGTAQPPLLRTLHAAQATLHNICSLYFRSSSMSCSSSSRCCST